MLTANRQISGLKYTGKIINRTRTRCVTKLETIVTNKDENSGKQNRENEVQI